MRLLQKIVSKNLFSENLARYYTLKELAKANVNLEDLLSPSDLAIVEHQFKLGQSSQQAIRIQTNDYQKFLLKNIQVPSELKNEPIVIIGAATESLPDETVL